MDIRIVKLISGEAVISEVEFTNDSVMLIDPQTFAPTPQGIALIPWLIGSVGPYEISLMNVICFSFPIPEATEIYKQHTGKGIISSL